MRLGDFSKKTIQQLAEATNHHCARCKAVTSYFDSSSGKRVSIATASHIVSASPYGPRADIDYTVEQLKAADNGVHLCANCARLVDRIEEEFPPEMLKNMQRDAEIRVRDSVIQTPGGFALNIHYVNNIVNFYKEASAIINSFHTVLCAKDWHLMYWAYNDKIKALDFFRDCHCIHLLQNKFCGGCESVINLQEMVVKNILILIKEVEKEPWAYCGDSYRLETAFGQKEIVENIWNKIKSILDDSRYLLLDISNYANGNSY